MENSNGNQNEKGNKINVLRWIMLLPVVCITWIVCLMVVFGVYVLVYNSVLDEWLVSFSTDFARFAILGLPISIISGIAEFFVTRAIVPKYKTWLAWIMVILSVAWSYYMMWGLAYMAY